MLGVARVLRNNVVDAHDSRTWPGRTNRDPTNNLQLGLSDTDIISCIYAIY